jgi:NhaP-type Na+/H+ or K+/H+ antiporter
MDQFEIHIWLLGIVVCVGILGKKLSAPTPLLLVIAGMLLSFVPHFPQIKLHEDLVLNFYLPLLVYESTALISWPEVKLNKRPIALLSIGHVIFITVLVAVTAHALIPELSWPLAFVLGAVVSPPDDVAIFAIADKVTLPKRVLTVLMGEGLLNDACALILFRFSLAAVITHEFYPLQAFYQFIAIIVLETIYGYVLGHLIGQLRLRIHDPMLQIIISVLTPFLAYLPAVRLGGSGVLATVVTGLVIGVIITLNVLTPPCVCYGRRYGKR